jgi:hypothetical protein
MSGTYLYCQNPACGEYLGSLGGDSCHLCGWCCDADYYSEEAADIAESKARNAGVAGGPVGAPVTIHLTRDPDTGEVLRGDPPGVAPCQTCAANHYCPEHNPAPRIQKRDKPKRADGVQEVPRG